MYQNKKTLNDLDLNNKKVIVRFDFNVPIKDGMIKNDKRIMAAIPTIKYLLDHNCSIIALSHLSRIKTVDDIKSNQKSLAPVAKKLSQLLPEINVLFEPSLDFKKIKTTAKNLKSKEILLLENTRYYDVDEKNKVVKLESKNDAKLAKFYASLAECFVNDAFGTAHRAHASNAGIAKNIKNSCIGFLVQQEVEKISNAIDNPIRPYVAILGGAKVSDKLKVIDNLIQKADKIIICGGMSYTFSSALGYDIGKSICEPDMIETAKKIIDKAKDKLVIATDAMCATEFADVKPIRIDIASGLKEYQGLDIGKKSIKEFKKVLKTAKTIVWNGPCGVTEFSHYQNGTYQIAKLLKKLTKKDCYTLIGGGDSAAAIIDLGFKESDFSFVSTGGGASLALIEGSSLVGIDPISNKAGNK